MVVGVKNWSTTAATNASADSNINWAENQAPSTVNDSARAMMATLAAAYDQIGGALTVGGSSNAYTITNATPGVWAAYALGDIIMMKANHTCSGAATLNVDGLGAKAITKNGTSAVIANDLLSGAYYLLSYDGTQFQIIGALSSGVYQPLDATLTAVAGLTTDATNSFLRFTASDVVTAEAAAAHRTALGIGTGDSPQLTAINLGHASDTTITRVSAGLIAVEGNTVAMLTGVQAFGSRPTFNSNTPLDSANVATYALPIGGGTMTGDITISKATPLLDLVGTSTNVPAVQFRNAARYDDIRNTTSGMSFRTDTSGTPEEMLLTATGVQARVAASSETTGSLTAASANKQVNCSGGITLANSVFKAGDKITFDPGTSARTFTRGSGVTMYLNAVDSGTATLAANAMGGVHWRSASVAILTGAFS